MVTDLIFIGQFELFLELVSWPFCCSLCTVIISLYSFFCSISFQDRDRMKILILYLKFIKAAFNCHIFNEVKSSQIVEELKDCVQLVTNKGIKRPQEEVIHFSSEYKDQWDLPKQFPGMF